MVFCTVATQTPLLGIFPIIGGLFQAMPQPVLGGATLLMFSSVVAAGIKILYEVNLSQRNTLILIVSLGLGIGVSFVPEILENTPYLIKSVFFLWHRYGRHSSPRS